MRKLYNLDLPVLQSPVEWRSAVDHQQIHDFDVAIFRWQADPWNWHQSHKFTASMCLPAAPRDTCVGKIPQFTHVWKIIDLVKCIQCFIPK